LISSPRCRRPTPDEVAYHEAGHVVVGSRLGLDLVEVDVEPDGEGGNGHSVFRQPDWFDPSSDGDEDGRGRVFVENLITTFLAGTAAEARRAGFENPESSGFDEDAIVRSWAAYLGPGREASLGRLRQQAAGLVREPANWEAIGRLAGLLIERRRLDGAEAVAAVRGTRPRPSRPR
jgi:hypothetical protein